MTRQQGANRRKLSYFVFRDEIVLKQENSKNVKKFVKSDETKETAKCQTQISTATRATSARNPKNPKPIRRRKVRMIHFYQRQNGLLLSFDNSVDDIIEQQILNVGAAVEKPEFEILSPEQICHEMKKCIEEVSSVIQVSSDQFFDSSLKMGF